MTQHRRLPGHRRDRRRDPAREPQQVRVRRGGRRLPAGPRPLLGRLLQLRLRLHRGDARRRRRPHRRPPGHRRAHLHRLPRLGPADRRARDERRERLRLQGPVRRARRPAPGAHQPPRPGAAAPARRDRALLPDLQAAREQGRPRSWAGATATAPSRCCARTARPGVASGPTSRGRRRDALASARWRPGERRLFVAVPLGEARAAWPPDGGLGARRRRSRPDPGAPPAARLRWVRRREPPPHAPLPRADAGRPRSPTSAARAAGRRPRSAPVRGRAWRAPAPSRRRPGRGPSGLAWPTAADALGGARGDARRPSSPLPAGRRDERPFRAHLTLARADGVAGGAGRRSARSRPRRPRARRRPGPRTGSCSTRACWAGGPRPLRGPARGARLPRRALREPRPAALSPRGPARRRARTVRVLAPPPARARRR